MNREWRSWGADDSSGTTCSWATHNAGWDVLTGLSLGGVDAETSYDAAGRESGGTITWDNVWNCGDTQCEDSGSGSNSRQYDAENHLIGQTYTNWQTWSGSVTCPANWTGGSGKGYVTVNIGLSYKWGPNGHVVEAGNNSSGTMQYETLHWDGGQVLFTTSAAGTADDLKLGGDADITVPGGSPTASFTQRDFSGATGDPPNASRQLCASGTHPYIWQPGPDGITDGYNVFQGVRNYDPAAGTWSSPDAYQGEVGDPMSQRAYMWNRNNSFVYADPSGYNPFGDFATNVWNAVAGDDIKTLKSNAGVGAKVIAAADLVSTVAMPEKGAVETLGKVVLKVAAKDLAEHTAVASMSTLLKASYGAGTAILGAGTSKTLRDAGRLASQYGGKAADWATMAISSGKLADGSRVEIHYYKNVRTGATEEFKSVIQRTAM